MNDNKLLEFWLGLTEPDLRVATYFADNNIDGTPIVHIDLIKRLAKYDAIRDDLGYPDFVELFVNSYVNELLEKCSLKRGLSKSGHHPTWGGNWFYRRGLEPGMIIEGDFDNEKDYLRMSLTMPADLKARAMDETYLFMEKAKIRRVDIQTNI